MRILDQDADRALQRITLFLTTKELQEMISQLQRLASDLSEQHVHLNDEDYIKEITVAVYTDSNLDSFDERSRRLISEDE